MRGFEEPKKPLAGNCYHRWEDQETPYVVAQVCGLCKLFRYKASATSDWEYRAPIPFARIEKEDKPISGE
ncbi:MAG TPA: hypothetical protein VJQ83_09080 [Tepidiformaceae bacterium]|nr:hypothetical protein [Tepidiformaceae bacterium]